MVGLRKVAWIKEIAANFEKVALADQRDDRLGRFFYPASQLERTHDGRITNLFNIILKSMY
jgi:hypothetical protein